jgi:hypothetical protein
MPSSERNREVQIRRMAARQFLTMSKSRRRDPYAADFGRFMLLDKDGLPILGHEPFEYSATLDEIEAFLKRDRTSTRTGEGE